MWLTLENLLRETVKWQHSVGLPIRHTAWSVDEVSGEERQEKCTFARFWKGSHEPVAIRRKSDVRAHCRANRQSESEMEPWNLDWRGSND